MPPKPLVLIGIFVAFLLVFSLLSRSVTTPEPDVIHKITNKECKSTLEFAPADLFTFKPSVLDRHSEKFWKLAKAQDKEDLIAMELFFWDKPKRGIILESGALDGNVFSTSFIYQQMGWEVYHVEASPKNFKRLMKNRPHSNNLHVAICDKTRQIHFLEANAIGGILEFMSASFIAQWHPKLNAILDGNDPSNFDWGEHLSPEFRKAHQNIHDVACVPVSEVFCAFNLKHIDFWVLDVENAELLVLSTVDWDKVTIDVLVIECDAHDRKRNAQIRELLESKGYDWLGRQSRNYWFTRKGFEPSRRPDAQEWITPNQI